MKHTILICGYSLGISRTVTRRFGKAGHPVVIIARNAQHLDFAEKQWRSRVFKLGLCQPT
ncbi:MULTISPECIES: hypothetical protein [Xenorhabdus]|uniref:hypothetical protein n=1 Tax=Xenorhabdus TaxID=626 RepID=UPI0030CC7360